MFVLLGGGGAGQGRWGLALATLEFWGGVKVS